MSSPHSRTAPRRAPSVPDRWLLAILALQVAVSVPGMATRTVWLDEAFTAVTARGTLADIREALANDNGPPLHYVLVHLWRTVAGESPLALRALSLGFTLAATFLLYRLARRLFDVRVARTAALLWALNPLAVYYANQIRMYALLSVVALAFLSTVWRPGVPWTWRRCALLAVWLAALAYTHNIGMFVAAAGLLAVLLVTRDATLFRVLPAAGVLAFVAYLPWLPVFARQLADADRSAFWMKYVWSPWNPIYSLAAFVPWGKTPSFTDLPGLSALWWVVPLLVWSVALLRAVARAGPERAHVRFLAAFLALGLLLPAVYSWARQPIYLPGRHDFAVLPAFLLLCAVGAWRLRPSLRNVLLAAMTAASAAAVVAWHSRSPALEEKAWIQVLRDGARPGDVVVAGPNTLPQTEYYLSGRGLTFLAYPTALRKQPALFDLDWYVANTDLRADAARVGLSAVQEARGGAIWMVAPSFMMQYQKPVIDRALESGFRQTAQLAGNGMGLAHVGWPILLFRLERDERLGAPGRGTATGR